MMLGFLILVAFFVYVHVIENDDLEENTNDVEFSEIMVEITYNNGESFMTYEPNRIVDVIRNGELTTISANRIQEKDCIVNAEPMINNLIVEKVEVK